MKLKVECKLTGTFVQRKSGVKLLVDNVVSKEYNEDSPEYEELCELWRNTIGFDREVDKDNFDKQLLTLIAEQAKQTLKTSVEKIVKTFKCVWIDARTPSFVEFGGYLLNPKDFSAIRISEIKTDISKH